MRCGETAAERSVLIASWLVVLIVELINSAIETVVDRIGADRYELGTRQGFGLGVSVPLFCLQWFGC